MKVIICGAGEVGFGIARHLAGEGGDVAVIDQSPELIRRVSDAIDVQAMVGQASHPGTLEQAGAADADLLIGVTLSDEVNMVACQIAHSLFKVPTKIARVREQSYLKPVWADLFSRDHLPIDVCISPELEVARAIARRLRVPGAFDAIPMANGLVQILGIRLGTECPVAHTPLRQLSGLFPDLEVKILVILRQGRLVMPHADSQLYPGDEIYAVVEKNDIFRTMMAFGHEEREAIRVIIFGGGHVGTHLAALITENDPSVTLKLIEINEKTAEVLSSNLDHVVVLNGSALDPEILHEAGCHMADAVIAVTNEDETNALASLLAIHAAARRTITLANNPVYAPLLTAQGIDAVVNPRAITVSTILQHVRRGRIKAVQSLGEGIGEIMEFKALETSPLLNKPLNTLSFPEQTIIGAIMRDDTILFPKSDLVIQSGDHVILFAAASAVRDVEKAFSARLEFF